MTVLTSCDYFSEGYIKNDTNKDVIIIAQLDTSITRHYWVSVTRFLNSYANDTSCIKLGMDTTNFMAIYLLKSNSSIETDGGNDKYCTTKFRYLQIRKHDDTITYYSNEEIAKAFTFDKEPCYHELTIK